MEQAQVLQGIDTVIVRVSDIDASRQWYMQRLGLTVIWDDPAMKLVVLDTSGPTSLTLWQTSKTITQDKDTAAYPIFRTTNAAQARAILQQRGVLVDELVQDDAVVYFVFYDPDGNILEACQVHG